MGHDVLQKKLDGFLMDRALDFKKEDLGNEIAEYEAVINEYQKVFDSIKEQLSMENKKLMLKLDELETEIGFYEKKCAYQKGLNDGMELAQGLRVFGMDKALIVMPVGRLKAVVG